MISIPAVLLWRVHISLRRKLLLAGVLCLSIFMIVISIIKITTADLPDGQVDSAWGIFWLQAEACVGVIMVSISAFRSLFSTGGGRQPYKPSPAPDAHGGLWQPRKMHIELTGTTLPTLLGTESSRSDFEWPTRATSGSLETARTAEDSSTTYTRDIQTRDVSKAFHFGTYEPGLTTLGTIPQEQTTFTRNVCVITRLFLSGGQKDTTACFRLYEGSTNGYY